MPRFYVSLKTTKTEVDRYAITATVEALTRFQAFLQVYRSVRKESRNAPILGLNRIVFLNS